MSASHGTVIHHDPPAVVGRRERLGVRLIIVADASFVFAMVFTYFYLRNLDLNQGWLPKDGHTFSISSGWVTTIPLVIAALTHRAFQSNRSISLLPFATFVVLLIGGYLQWKQLASMPFIVEDTKTFEGAYASSWFIIGGANFLHYILGSFVALGIALRNQREKIDPVLKDWRLATASTWFNWIAISGVICAITISII